MVLVFLENLLGELGLKGQSAILWRSNVCASLDKAVGFRQLIDS
jgi:hypothetical protein